MRQTPCPQRHQYALSLGSPKQGKAFYLEHAMCVTFVYGSLLKQPSAVLWRLEIGSCDLKWMFQRFLFNESQVHRLLYFSNNFHRNIHSMVTVGKGLRREWFIRAVVGCPRIFCWWLQYAAFYDDKAPAVLHARVCITELCLLFCWCPAEMAIHQGV